MRDKGTRRSFRVRAAVFYALFCGIVCLPLLVCGLSWFSYNIWKENTVLRENVLRFEDDFQKAQSIAERLENIEELLNENAVVGKDVLLRRLAASSGTGSAASSGDPADSLSENGQTSQSPPPVQQQDVFPAINADYIRVDNVQARALRENRLRIALDLRNTDNQKIAAGRVSAVLLTADGARHELVFAPYNVGDFRISRFKRTVMYANLAPQLNLVNSQVILEVRREDNSVVYRNLFAVER
ncbi:MAG: hypothetical protein LBR94_00275 [Desulfovibrio sp.]|jgi:hypothetical protein|nr:hypothetical protein [Desulfovibrio sp.]